jgi:hypothetical protein
MSYIDTRDLIKEREELRQQILDDFNERFNLGETDFDMIEAYFNGESSENITEDERQEFYEYWIEEQGKINEINDLENEVGSEWEDGVTLIEEDDFEEYCKELLEDCGYISKDFPVWIEIDWDATANNVRQDYQEVEFRGTNYLFR